MKLHAQQPQIGAWYQLQDYPHSLIEIVAVDQRDGTVTTQCVDGELDEIDLEQWPELSPHKINGHDMDDEYHWARAASFTENLEPDELNESEWSELSVEAQTALHFFMPTDSEDAKRMH